MSERPIRFEEVLEKEGQLIYSIKGISMRPLLKQGRDLFIVEKAQGPFSRGQVILFKRGDKYVLHRIIAVAPGEYTALGDNSYMKDWHIREEDVLGLMTGYIRKGKTHHTDEGAYRLYSRWIRLSRPLRVIYIRNKAKLRKWIRNR